MKDFESEMDSSELLFKTAILSSFPNYALFWNNLIVVRTSKRGRKLPYGLKYSASVSASQ
jgi:hypothetical protein